MRRFPRDRNRALVDVLRVQSHLQANILNRGKPFCAANYITTRIYAYIHNTAFVQSLLGQKLSSKPE